MTIAAARSRSVELKGISGVTMRVAIRAFIAPGCLVLIYRVGKSACSRIINIAVTDFTETGGLPNDVIGPYRTSRRIVDHRISDLDVTIVGFLKPGRHGIRALIGEDIETRGSTVIGMAAMAIKATDIVVRIFRTRTRIIGRVAMHLVGMTSLTQIGAQLCRIIPVGDTVVTDRV